MELKSRHTVRECQIILRQHQQLKNELDAQHQDKIEAEQEIQRLNEDYIGAVDADERQRIAGLQGQAVADRGQAVRRIELLKEQMDAVNNDYMISGYDELLGSLDHPSSFNFR